MYKQVNANPKNKKVADCVIRAFVHATGKTWENVLTDLFEIAIVEKCIPNEKGAYEKYAINLGFKKRKVTLENGHKPTVSSFAKNNPKGTFILRVANHLVTVVNGEYLDTWDSGYKSVYMYWEK